MSGVDELVAFVRARLNEREALLLHTRASDISCPIPISTLLAEVEAKRRVLDRYADMHWHAPAIPGATSSILQVEDTGACRTCVTVQILAQPYAGQDGWQEEWRA